MKSEEICYFCGEPKTTREHIPPRNITPKGDKYRNNYITVPSCDKHNTEKSHLDNKMAMFFCGTSSWVFEDKDFKAKRDSVIRAVIRDNHLFNNQSKDSKIFRKKDTTPILLSASNYNQEVNINYKEHKYYQECILRGLYFKENNKVWDGELFIIPDSLIGFDETGDIFKSLFKMNEFRASTSDTSNKTSKEKVFQHKKYQVDNIIIIGVCIYMDYYFYGLFCDKENLNYLREMFHTTEEMMDFNSY
ncbi:hypothetical protein [Pectobacterium carotovorum]|uniref:hypothetical protein n=1 Tax=Pectobacterium carotovorum TaxID=554 RepID=UPI003826C408